MTLWQCGNATGSRQEVLEEFVRIFLMALKSGGLRPNEVSFFAL